MKLYFYFLKAQWNGEFYINLEECQVIEKPKTYYPVYKFPKGFCGSCVRKLDIGRIYGFFEDVVIMTEKNNNFVMDLFNNNERKKQNELKNKLAQVEAKMNAIESFRKEPK